MPNGSVGDELTRVEEWLTATLSGNATLIALLAEHAGGVHADQAPKGAKYPLVIFQYQGGADIRGAGPLRIATNGVWIVKAIGETRNKLDVKPTADQIDVLLQAASGTADGANIFSCVRDAPFQFSEHSDDGHDYRHLGGRYRILAQHIP